MVRLAKRTLILITFLTAFALASPVKDVHVCSTCETTSILKGIEQVSPGGTVHVAEGVYREGEIIITKPLTLEGSNYPVIDGEEKVQPLTIRMTDNVTIRGFQIMNTGKSYIAEIAGVRVIQSKDCIIENNHIDGATYGVYLEKSENCSIQGNDFKSNAKDEVSGGNGIHVWTGSGHTIAGNSVRGHRDGIYLEFAKGCKVHGNRVTNNLRYGLHFMSSNKTSYSENSFQNNGSGVAVMYSKEIDMRRNRFLRNTGSAAYGLLLKDISDSHIVENDFEDNTVAIFMEGSNRTEIRRNYIKNNGWGLRIMSDCLDDIVSENNFISNSFEVGTNAEHSFNTYRGNYWSHYDGYDLNLDGIGDRPHRPVSVSSIILERVDSSFVLINSMLFTLLDAMEQALPQMIPEPLKDEEPLMKFKDEGWK